MPEGLRRIKEREKRWYSRLAEGLASFFITVQVELKRLLTWGRTRIVFAIIPQSERPPRKFEIGRFSLLIIVLTVVICVGAAIISIGAYGAKSIRVVSLEAQLSDAYGTIDRMRESSENLISETTKFEEKLGQVIEIAQSRGKPALQRSASEEILKTAGLDDPILGQFSDDPVSRDLLKLDSIAETLDKSLGALDDIAKILASQKDILTEVPNIWPIKGNLGHISMYFGQNENPFSKGQWYLHTGIDISTNRIGDSILATADGKVIDIHYDSSLGNSVTIQHSHGFTTRYGHLRSFAVKKGQRVFQGDVIGYLGNTGKTTGPHLHYEVYLGTSLIDPLRFLNIRKEYHE
ncbi:MAG TPA: M23 family metallopeptidase [Rectinema sp.]|nr:M23 family metallopeptidase [Rectinema sp.]HOH17354.1 M23 family metallopeptidase [Rectinema sp.]HOO02755.1 M23 family metallopeptidase [Rectinema sp.]HOR91281.1 M23 family metallopeptidase [Rectinema sp.]HOU61699.1 M23 family metallopeptidase [Rectinema sp.]